MNDLLRLYRYVCREGCTVTIEKADFAMQWVVVEIEDRRGETFRMKVKLSALERDPLRPFLNAPCCALARCKTEEQA